ncbi:hypothetical protein J3F84DRAFT_271193 [Trichoderma pleuroticola]
MLTLYTLQTSCCHWKLMLDVPIGPCCLVASLGTARPCKDPTTLLLCLATACSRQRTPRRLRCMRSTKTRHKRRTSCMRLPVSLAQGLLDKLRSYYGTSIRHSRSLNKMYVCMDMYIYKHL